MKQRLLTILLTLLPLIASADTIEINGIYYIINISDKTAEVTINPNNYRGEVIIPEFVKYMDDEFIVNSIGNEAFAFCPDLLTVTIGKNVSIIKDYAFAFSKLLSINIPNSVKTIGAECFIYCQNLTNIDLPNSINNIPAGMFGGCNGLSSVNIPTSVSVIESGAFLDCTNLASIDIPNSITKIGPRAFSGCSKLLSIKIPSNLAFVGTDAFQGCESLKAVYISNLP